MIEKFRIVRYFMQTSLRRQHLDREALAVWQLQQFAHFAKQTLQQSPFYRAYETCELGDYPIIDKSIWVDNFDQINTKGLKAKNLFELALASERSREFDIAAGDIAVGLSSGTSGKRSLFVTDKYERARYAGTILAKCLGKDVFKRQRIALLLRANNKLYETINGGSRIKFQYFDLQRPWTEILESLQKFQPSALVGAPQVLSLIAQAQMAGVLKLSPCKIIASAEVLETKEKNEIESAFGVLVDQIYQATEGFLGATCRHGSIHLNEDAIIVEKQWLDSGTRRFVPVITDFVRTTQPLIRYRLNDVLIEREHPCACGSLFTAIEKIEGREDDILFVHDKEESRKLVPVMPDFIRDAMALSADTILDYRFVQHSFDKLEIAVEGPEIEQAKDRAAENIKRLFDSLNLKVPELIFADKITADMHVKLRRVRRLFPMTEVFEWNAS
jgi:putative adenylate-forming enzyme